MEGFAQRLLLQRITKWRREQEYFEPRSLRREIVHCFTDEGAHLGFAAGSALRGLSWTSRRSNIIVTGHYLRERMKVPSSMQRFKQSLRNLMPQFSRPLSGRFSKLQVL